LEDKEQKTVRSYSTEETTNFKIYEMPSPLALRLISYAKSHAGNKVWVAIEQLLDREDLVRRVGLIEERLTKLETEDGKV